MSYDLLEQILEAVTLPRSYSWHDQVVSLFPSYPPVERSEVVVADNRVTLKLTDCDAVLLRNWLIQVYGYPKKVLISVGNPGPSAE